jgi:spectinomycin phosphotransferase
MREPPVAVTNPAVLQTLRDGWELDVAEIEHLPWGFGSWHWAASDGQRRRWFVTADELDYAGRAEELEMTYAAALALHAGGLGFVVPCIPSTDGRITLPLNGLALSITEWVEGTPAGGELVGEAAEQTSQMVRLLHDTTPPPQVLVWDDQLRWRNDLERLDALLEQNWSSGPFAAAAQTALRAHRAELPGWLARFEERAGQALERRDTWVTTHGEPGLHNQLVTRAGRRMVDWESMRVAPRERDLTDLVKTGGWSSPRCPEPDPAMLELFDLRWRLNEIGAYMDWFRAPHIGTEDDRIALDGLVEELDRSDWIVTG